MYLRISPQHYKLLHLKTTEYRMFSVKKINFSVKTKDEMSFNQQDN